MNKCILIIFLFVSILGSVRAQEIRMTEKEMRMAEEEMPQRKGKFFLVPEFWLSFGSSTYIDIAPMLGYHAWSV